MLISLTLHPSSFLMCRKLFFKAADLRKATAKGAGDSQPPTRENYHPAWRIVLEEKYEMPDCLLMGIICSSLPSLLISHQRQ